MTHVNRYGDRRPPCLRRVRAMSDLREDSRSREFLQRDGAPFGGHGRGCGGDEDGREPCCEGVKRRRLHAEVQRQAAKPHSVDAALSHVFIQACSIKRRILI